MINDVIVIDDIFDDPDELVFQARNMKYYDVYSHPGYCEEVEQKIVYYPGYRTRTLQREDNKLYEYCQKTIIEKTLDKGIGLYRSDVSVSYLGLLYFHYITSESIIDERWLHKDPCLIAGVVYLKKNPPPNTGTILIKDGKEIHIENKYNRLVLYRSDILHSVQNTFGNNLYDGRLTLTIFYHNLSLNMSFNDKKIATNKQEA